MTTRSDLVSVFKEGMQGFTNEEMRQKTIVNYDKKLLRKSNSHCKHDDVVTVANISYIGRRMIKINYSVYSQR
jgi:hypothetical protein